MIKGKQVLQVFIHNRCDDFIGEDFFLTGNMVNWKVDGIYLGKIPAVGETVAITLKEISLTALELKINRGTWHSLTASKEGTLLAPYHVEDGTATELHIYIDAWRDQYKRSTASTQVQVMDASFYFPSLEMSKKIWIYLPKEYTTSVNHYPVLYMHDGQHLFDEATSQGRTGPIEWKVDKVIDAAVQDAIVIAIAHAETVEQRFEEYLLFPFEATRQPKGDKYLYDIVHTLKPYVDQHYRTLKTKAFTAMAGSSLGGLLSLEAGLMYPEVFGFLGVFSPSIWTAEEQVHHLFEQAIQGDVASIGSQGYFYYAGGKEKRKGEEGDVALMLTNMLELAHKHEHKTSATIYIDVDDNGKHGAQYWQKVFPRFFECWQSFMAADHRKVKA